VDDSPEYTEWLMVLFTRFLARQDTMPVGEALRLAKQHYLGTAPSGGVSIYHYKVLLEATLYGLPMLQVDVPGGGRAIKDQAAAASFGAPQTRGLSAAAIDVSVGTVPLSPTLHSTTDGQYYAIDGEIQASPGRPIQPKTSLSIPPFSGKSPHGAVLWQATFSDTTGFDPVITRPVTDVTLAEPDFWIGGWFPAKPWAVNRFGDEPQLVLVGGQFKDANPADGQGLGTERIYTDMTLLVYHSDLDHDYLPPTIWDSWALPVGKGIQVVVQTEDASGIEAVFATYQLLHEIGAQATSSGEWNSVPLSRVKSSSIWTGPIPGGDMGTIFFVQVVDKAGNVQMGGNKGIFFQAQAPGVYLPILLKNH
jgi:hypothetical protein